LFRVVKARGGGWHPVTGGVEEGESFEAGARREVSEETGFDSQAGMWTDLDCETRFEGRFGPALERAFLFQMNRKKNPKLDPSEHTDFKWVEIEEALKRIEYAGQKDALERVSGILKSG
jgi:dATP pyrophosphohydrolase